MIVDYPEFRREVISFLTSLRYIIDRPMRELRIDAEEKEDFLQTILMIEEARIRFNATTRGISFIPEQDWNDSAENLKNFVNRFMHSKIISPAIFQRKFRLAPMPSRDRENLTPFLRRIHEDGGLTVSEALLHFRSHLEFATSGSLQGQIGLDFENIEKLVPQQQVAPVQFEIANGKIVVSPQEPKTLAKDRKNIDSSLDYLTGSGEKLIENLTNSNCDRRLLDSVRELQAQLVSGGNIVKIGLTNMACSMMCEKFNAELPDAVAAMFSSYNSAVSLYVSQFPEWEQFAQKASLINLDHNDISDVDAAAVKVIGQLAARPEIADPDVPATIEFVRQFLNSPGKSSTRAAFAMIRTIENLISIILRHSADLIGRTAEKSKERVAQIGAATIAALLSIALAGAVGIGPAATKAGAPWVQQAIEIVQKQIEKAAK